MLTLRPATIADLPAIELIYNQGIEDGIATLEHAPKTAAEMRAWFDGHGKRYVVMAALDGDELVGWASLNRYSHRCAHDGVADLSIYVRRDKRGLGVGRQLMAALEHAAAAASFHKIVLFALTANEAGRRLYDSRGFREVGVFQEQGKLNGDFVDVLIMEKLLKKR